MWSEKCDSDLFFAKIIWNDSFSWSCLIISSSIFLIRQVSFLTNDACSFSIIEWRMFILDLSSDVYDETSNLTKHFIKFDKNDSLNLTRHFIKLDESDSSNLIKATYQTWWKRRHFIKFDESVISSNLRSSSHQTFWKKRQCFYYLMSDTVSCNNAWYKEFNLAKIIFILREDKWAFLMKIDADITQFFLKEELQVKSKQLEDDCCRSNNSNS
jgi:hypothetical protein